MNRTRSLFETRKEEIENLYNTIVMADAEAHSNIVPILKSTFVIMLYTLMESCILEGFKEIYEIIPESFPTHDTLNEKLVSRWISKVVRDNSKKPDEYLAILLQQVINEPARTIDIGKIEEMKDISSGNLDKNWIKKLLVSHGIPISRSSRGRIGKHTEYIKERRNKLSHGEESFAVSMRDCPVTTSEEGLQSILGIKEDIVDYMESVIGDMAEFYDNKLYLKQIENENIE